MHRGTIEHVEWVADQFGPVADRAGLDTAGLHVIADCVDSAGLPPRARALLISELARALINQSLAGESTPEASHRSVAVISAPRTGTTLVHWLLGAHSSTWFQSHLECHFDIRAASLQPKRDAIIAKEIPQLIALHPHAPARPEEDDVVSEWVFRSFRLAALVPLDNYVRWLSASDFLEYRTGVDYALGRPVHASGVSVRVAKSPFFALASNELNAALRPDALVVIYRPAGEVWASWAGLIRAMRGALGLGVHGCDVVWIDIFRRVFASLARLAHDERVVVIDYRALVADPIAAVLPLLDELGLGTDASSVDRMGAALAELRRLSRAQVLPRRTPLEWPEAQAYDETYRAILLRD